MDGRLLAITAGILWGITPWLTKRGLRHSSAGAAALIEGAIGVPFIGVFALLSPSVSFATLTLKAVIIFVVSGIVGASLGKIFYIKGIDKVGSAKSTSLKNSAPLITTFLGILFLGEQITAGILGGVVLVVTGIFFLSRELEVSIRGGGEGGGGLHVIYPLLAALCYSFNPVFKKLGMLEVNSPILGTFFSQTTSFLVFFIYFLIRGRLGEVRRINRGGFFFFGLSGLLGNLAALCTYYAVTTAPVIVVSPLWRISPVVTLVLAYFGLGKVERITVADGVGTAAIMLGVFSLSR